MTTALGLPRTLRDVDSESVVPIMKHSTAHDSSDLPNDEDIGLATTNAHAKLIHIMARAVDFNQPLMKPVCQKNGFYGVEYSKIAQAEEELNAWYEALSSSPALSLDSDGDLKRLR